MKGVVVYSSRTGNTKRIAQAIFEVLPAGTEIYTVESAPKPDSYDFVVIGFWVDKGKVDLESAEYMSKVAGKKVAVFGTMGYSPNSEHAERCLENSRELLEGNEIIGEFLCQGRVEHSLFVKMKSFPYNVQNPLTEEDKVIFAEAAKHPGQDDFNKARTVFKNIVKKYLE